MDHAVALAPLLAESIPCGNGAGSGVATAQGLAPFRVPGRLNALADPAF
jgi:hypothetical protein